MKSRDFKADIPILQTLGAENYDKLDQSMEIDLKKALKKFVKDWCYGHKENEKMLMLHKISFVGHSLGGLIIRAALEYLQPDFKSFFHAFISLGTPHLGYMHNSPPLVNAGLWLLQNVVKKRA